MAKCYKPSQVNLGSDLVIFWIVSCVRIKRDVRISMVNCLAHCDWITQTLPSGSREVLGFHDLLMLLEKCGLSPAGEGSGSLPEHCKEGT